MTCFLLLLWAASPLCSKILGPLGLRLLRQWFLPHYLSDQLILCFFPASTPCHVWTTAVNMQITRTTLQPCPAAQAAAGNIIIMRVWHTHTWCTAAAVAMCYIATSVQQYTYGSKPMVWFVHQGKVISSPRGDDFESDDQNNPA